MAIRYRQVPIQERHHAADKPLSLSKQQLEHRPRHQRHLDREVEELPLPTRGRPIGRNTSHRRLLRDPEAEVARLHQPLIILSPVLDLTPRHRDMMAARIIVFVRHRSVR